jgi:hypothetical protein
MATSLRSRTTVKPAAKDSLDVGMVSFRTVLTSVDPDEEVIPPEDIRERESRSTKSYRQSCRSNSDGRRVESRI